ncbi:Acetamidase [Hyphodiscus hymeniophilus]|uniref:amidase n=1 Tax=Hyphodiscus hymeniophilus TaxID=353542 RepID=A0A9P6VP82_9HELO|nr:Acetamidase [Hyphodiscus hymeniophilus]
MDPYRIPPQKLKTIFKELRSVKDTNDPRIAAPDILDFGSASHTESVERLNFLEKIFDRFHSENVVSQPVSLNSSLPSSNSYTVNGIPGVTIYPGILPPKTQRVLLDKLLHRDLSNPKHQTNLHLHYEVSYPSHATSFFAASKSDVLFKPRDPKVHKGLEMKQVLQTKMRWMTLGGQYDWTNKVYPEEVPPEFPADVGNLIRDIVDGMDPQAAIVNIYSPGDTLSMHRDVSEEVNQPLVSISLGCECLFLIAIEDHTMEAGFRHVVIRLRSGDALVITRSNKNQFALANMVDWRALAKEKRDSVNALIPKSWILSTPLPSASEQRDVTSKYIQQFLSPREIEITETDAVGIVESTTSGKWKAREVAEAFYLVLMIEQVNCLHEIFFDAAIADAQKLDDYYAEHQKPVGPLHGLPVSLKDQFHVKDVETTMGYVGWIGTFEGKKGTGKEKVFESEMVRELRDLGAVLYCKTSVPHTLMAGETVNNIIGYTYNPKNRNLASGGSSGGEGALIGLRGSPVGFGTDIGGSIRIPAAFNGLYGIRPSAGRLPYEGMANSMDGQNSIQSVVGPLATSVGALRLVIKSVLSQQPWLHDPLVAEIPWRDEQEQAVLNLVKTGGGGQLSFGILRSDGVVRPQPPVRRAVEIVVKTIEKLGHKVIEWQPPSHELAFDIAFKTWKFDGGADVHGVFKLTGEPMASQVAATYGSLGEQFTASEIAAVNIAKRQYQKDYMDYWNSTSSLTGTGRPVDAIVAPLAPFAAARPNMYDYYGTLLLELTAIFRVSPGYSAWVNLLDYSAAVLPVTTADKSIDVVDEEYKPMNEPDMKVWKSYDPEIYNGAYVGLQIVGRRLQEEKVLALTEILGNAL